MSISDAIALLSITDDLEDFLYYYRQLKERERIEKELFEVESFRRAYSSMKTDTGHLQYKQWIHNQEDSYQETFKEKPKKTIWDNLKKEKKKQTIWDSLK